MNVSEIKNRWVRRAGVVLYLALFAAMLPFVAIAVYSKAAWDGVAVQVRADRKALPEMWEEVKDVWRS